MKKGFTLIEMLVVVLIVAILTGAALPRYLRSLERARATEAMSNVKVLNEAVYTYMAGRDAGEPCPTSFSKLPISIAGKPTDPANKRTTKNFVFKLNDADVAMIPGTSCKGVTATRTGGTKFKYVIWNPYVANNRSLACFAVTPDDTPVCESFGIQSATDQHGQSH